MTIITFLCLVFGQVVGKELGWINMNTDIKESLKNNRSSVELDYSSSTVILKGQNLPEYIGVYYSAREPGTIIQTIT